MSEEDGSLPNTNLTPNTQVPTQRPQSVLVFPSAPKKPDRGAPFMCHCLFLLLGLGMEPLKASRPSNKDMLGSPAEMEGVGGAAGQPLNLLPSK